MKKNVFKYMAEKRAEDAKLDKRKDKLEDQVCKRTQELVGKLVTYVGPTDKYARMWGYDLFEVNKLRGRKMVINLARIYTGTHVEVSVKMYDVKGEKVLKGLNRLVSGYTPLHYFEEYKEGK